MPAHQIGPAPVEHTHQAVVGVGDPPLLVQREESVREPLQGRDGGHSCPEVQDPAHQMGTCFPAGSMARHTSPQLNRAMPAAPLRDMETLSEYLAFLGRDAGGGPECGTVRLVHLSRQRGRLSVVLVRGQAEDRTHRGVGGEGTGAHVPVEQAHPDPGGGGDRDLQRLTTQAAPYVSTVRTQSGQHCAQSAGRGAQVPPLRLRQPLPVGPSGPHHGQHPQDLVPRRHGHGD